MKNNLLDEYKDMVEIQSDMVGYSCDRISTNRFNSSAIGIGEMGVKIRGSLHVSAPITVSGDIYLPNTSVMKIQNMIFDNNARITETGDTIRRLESRINDLQCQIIKLEERIKKNELI